MTEDVHRTHQGPPKVSVKLVHTTIKTPFVHPKKLPRELIPQCGRCEEEEEEAEQTIEERRQNDGIVKIMTLMMVIMKMWVMNDDDQDYDDSR